MQLPTILSPTETGASAPFELWDTADTRRWREPSVRQRLRDATAATHQTLHRHPEFVRLIEGRLTLPDYRILLARLYGFHGPLERELREAPPGLLRGVNVVERQRSPALRADLEFLGLRANEIDALPYCTSLRPIRSNADLWGRLYVVEGAGLGGRVLAASLDGLMGKGGTEGRRFLRGRAMPDPLPWPEFCRRLEAQGASTDIEAMIDSAQTTFGAMAQWLAGCEPHV